jgi:hypothetical protein
MIDLTGVHPQLSANPCGTGSASGGIPDSEDCRGDARGAATPAVDEDAGKVNGAGYAAEIGGA